MATGILIIGESGSGKSSSLRNLDSKETFLVNVQGKPLPFKGGREAYTKEHKNLYKTDSCSNIESVLHKISADEDKKHIKVIVIDDFQYIMVNEMMRKVSEKGYQKFTDIAHAIWSLVQCVSGLRDDLFVVFLAHTETTSTGKEKVKTVGKMLDDQVNIEGMFTIVLKAVYSNGKHIFTTHTNGLDTVKTPMGMFDDNGVDNDMDFVIKTIKEF